MSRNRFFMSLLDPFEWQEKKRISVNQSSFMVISSQVICNPYNVPSTSLFLPIRENQPGLFLVDKQWRSSRSPNYSTIWCWIRFLLTLIVWIKTDCETPSQVCMFCSVVSQQELFGPQESISRDTKNLYWPVRHSIISYGWTLQSSTLTTNVLQVP